jgi:glucose/arabinose dehydrogenase
MTPNANRFSVRADPSAEARASSPRSLARDRARGVIVALSLAALAVSAPPAAAQECPLAPRPIFAGHAFPLETTPTPGSMELVRMFPGLSFDSPVGLRAPSDGSNRIFIVERAGRIHVFENRDDVDSSTEFLDLSSEVSSGGERGLLGLAFDPDFAENGRFYVNYTADSSRCTANGTASWCTKIVRFEVSAADPDRADATSALEVLQYPQPFSNHNGGDIAFGPDGHLYIASGDGGGQGDPGDNGQDLSNRLGAVLRIDVRSAEPYAIPPDNPFVGTPGADPTIFHYGLRNPWRISFDRVTGDLYIADVGETDRE